jgi:hypothetical protein
MTRYKNIPDRAGDVIDRNTAPDQSHRRAAAENELLALSGTVIGDAPVMTTVLNLTGLWGGHRDVRLMVYRWTHAWGNLTGKERLGTTVSTLSAHIIHRLGRDWWPAWLPNASWR